VFSFRLSGPPLELNDCFLAENLVVYVVPFEIKLFLDFSSFSLLLTEIFLFAGFYPFTTTYYLLPPFYTGGLFSLFRLLGTAEGDFDSLWLYLGLLFERLLLFLLEGNGFL